MYWGAGIGGNERRRRRENCLPGRQTEVGQISPVGWKSFERAASPHGNWQKCWQLVTGTLSEKFSENIFSFEGCIALTCKQWFWWNTCRAVIYASFQKSYFFLVLVSATKEVVSLWYFQRKRWQCCLWWGSDWCASKREVLFLSTLPHFHASTLPHCGLYTPFIFATSTQQN